MARRRRLRLLVLFGLAAVAVWLLLLRLPTFSARGLERALSSFFQREVTVREVRWHSWPLEAEVLDVRVAGDRPGAPPFLEVPRIVAAPALQPLWRRRIVLARVRIERPLIRVHAYAEGGDDIPKLGGARAGFELRVRRLVIEDGEFQLDHRRVPLEVDLPDFRGRLAARSAGALGGSLSFGPGRLRFGDNPELALATEMEIGLEGPLLTVETGRLRFPKIDLAYEGQLRLQARPAGEFSLKGPVDLEQLDRHVMRTGFGIQGQARFDGRVWLEGSRLRLSGALLGSQGLFDGVAVPRFEGQLAWDDAGVHLRQLSLEALGGRGVFEVDVPPGKGLARLDAKVSEADTEAALRWIFDIGPLGIGSAATGDVALSWPRGRFREAVSGRVGLELGAKTDGRTPLWGRFDWRADKGVQLVEKAELFTPESGARIAGRVERDDRADLAVDAQTRDVAAADELLMRLRRALGAADAQRVGLSGRGEFHGLWRGTLQYPVFEGRFEGDDVGYLGVSWGKARFSGSVAPDELRMSALELQRGAAEARIEGRAGTGYYGDKDTLELRANLLGWPAEDFVKALGWSVELQGPLVGEVNLGGRRSAPEGELRLLSPSGRYYGVPFQDLELRAVLRGGRTEVRSGRAKLGSGVLHFHGSLSDDGHYDGAAEAEGVEIAELLKGAGPAWPLAGKVTGRVTLLGPLDRPRLRGELTSPRLFFGDEGLGAVQAAFLGKGDGQVGVDARCRSPRVDLTLAGTVAATGGAAELRVALKDTSVDPFLRVLYPALPSVATIVASGEADLSGPLGTPAKIQGQAQVSELLVGLPEYPVRNREPLRFRLEKDVLRVEELRLAGEGTDLRISGALGTSGQAPLDLSVEGAADLRVLSVVTRRLRGRGAARLAMKLRGDVETPRVEGTLELSGAGLRVRGFPAGVDGLQGTVRFSEAGAELEQVTGSLGGGLVELSGSAGYSQGGLSAVDIKLEGRRVTLPYPEGLRSVLDLELRFFGDAARQWLSGEIDVRHALWTRRYDLASELLAAGAPRAESGSLREGLRFDIKVRAPGTLEVDNNLATLRARAELSIAGSSEEPTVLGRAEIDRGRVYFQGNTYTIRRGTIDFTNPRRIDPQFNIEAETHIRSYRVTLNVSGTLERVYPTLSSDPPLSAVQIVNLLAGADETQVASLTQSQSDQARLAAAGAATLAAGRISEQVGLERQAQRLGLNRFSIDPALVKGDYTNPTARLTVGKRITPDLNVLYSIDLKSGKEQLISAEYTLSDRLSILLTSSEQGGLGVDIRVRQSR